MTDEKLTREEWAAAKLLSEDVLDLRDAIVELVAAVVDHDSITMDDWLATRRHIRALVNRVSQAAFQEGFQMAARIEQAAAKAALAEYALVVLGKDRGDGEIDLGALGKHYAP
jgi:predicted RNA-binding Zn ribbon-like protein